jgi:NAD-dependent deacetylase
MSDLVDEELIGRAADLMREADLVCTLTGAGISAESGIPTFRGEGGMWEDRRVEDLLSFEAFQTDPQRVWEFHKWWQRILARVRPNAGHTALVRMASLLPRFQLVTQNVDNLHQDAGSSDVIELHGNVWRVCCVSCKYHCDARSCSLGDEPHCPECGAWLRPDVVWFGEALPADAFGAAERAALSCDVMLVAGTSAIVHPAASLACWAQQNGADLIEVNPELTPLSQISRLRLAGRTGEVLPLIAERLSE